MAVEIHRVGVGVVNRYLVRDKGCILIDTGMPYTRGLLTRALGRLGIHPEEIRLIVLTHGHVDHAGAARAIQELTGARIAVHHRDQALLEQGLVVMPPLRTATGRWMQAVLEPVLRLLHFPPARADIVLGDEGLSLAEFGIRGRVIHTPGHSHGSVSILLDTGEAFVGDLASGGILLRGSPRLPPEAEDPPQIVASWRRLLAEGAQASYPGHGRPFPAELIRPVLD